jgi:hypothetical protein
MKLAMFANSPLLPKQFTSRFFKARIFGALVGLVLMLVAAHAPAQSTASVTLAWNPNTGNNTAGYQLYYGSSSQTYNDVLSVGNHTNATVLGLTPGVTYYFAVSALDTAGLESPLSKEIIFTPPVSTNSSAPVISLTSPSIGATYTAPASIGLAATVNPNGHTISKVQFYNGAVLLGESATAPYIFSWSSVGVGNYALSAKAVYDAGSIVASSFVGVSVTGVVTSPLPISLSPPWQAIDIGGASIPGATVESNGVFVLSGAGTIDGLSDNFRFVYQPLTGDGQITAQLSSVQNIAANGCTGVMIRESLASGSRYALMGLSSTDTFRWQRRNKTNFKTWSATGDAGVPPQVWVRLVRSGSSFIGYESTDQVNWTQVGFANISMASNIYIGLVVSSGDPGVLNTSTIGNLNVSP